MITKPIKLQLNLLRENLCIELAQLWLNIYLSDRDIYIYIYIYIYIFFFFFFFFFFPFRYVISSMCRFIYLFLIYPYYDVLHLLFLLNHLIGRG